MNDNELGAISDRIRSPLLRLLLPTFARLVLWCLTTLTGVRYAPYSALERKREESEE